MSTQDYDEWLHKRLRDPKEALAYLKAHMTVWGDETIWDAFKAFLRAVRTVARAWMGVKP